MVCFRGSILRSSTLHLRGEYHHRLVALGAIEIIGKLVELQGYLVTCATGFTQ